MPGPSPRRALLRDLAIAAGVLVGFELLAHAFPAPDPTLPGQGTTPDGQPALMLDGNPWLLWELSPGTFPVDGGTAAINRMGMRDGERGAKRGPRALVLGDSSVFGFGVGDHQLFTALMEQQLRAEVINAGVPGWSTTQARNMLELRGWDLEPDVLIVATLWSDNNFDRFVDSEVLADYGDAASSLAHGVRALARLSGMFRWADHLVQQSGQSARAQEIQRLHQDGESSGRRRVPLNTYLANLDAFAADMHARGGGVVYVQLANRPDMDEPDTPRMYDPYRDAMARVAERWDAPLVALPQVFREADRGDLFVDDVHPAAAGHRLMADAIGDALAARGWPERPLQLTPPSSPLPQLDDAYEGQGVELGLIEPGFGAPQAGERGTRQQRAGTQESSPGQPAQQPQGQAQPQPQGQPQPQPQGQPQHQPGRERGQPAPLNLPGLRGD